MPDTAAYLLVGAIAAVVTFATTPLVGFVARRLGWVVEPEEERHVHKVATPDVGGIAMLIGFVVAFLVARSMDTFAALFRSGDSEPPLGRGTWTRSPRAWTSRRFART